MENIGFLALEDPVKCAQTVGVGGQLTSGSPVLKPLECERSKRVDATSRKTWVFVLLETNTRLFFRKLYLQLCRRCLKAAPALRSLCAGCSL